MNPIQTLRHVVRKELANAADLAPSLQISEAQAAVDNLLAGQPGLTKEQQVENLNGAATLLTVLRDNLDPEAIKVAAANASATFLDARNAELDAIAQAMSQLAERMETIQAQMEALATDPVMAVKKAIDAAEAAAAEAAALAEVRDLEAHLAKKAADQAEAMGAFDSPDYEDEDADV